MPLPPHKKPLIFCMPYFRVMNITDFASNCRLLRCFNTFDAFRFRAGHTYSMPAFYQAMRISRSPSTSSISRHCAISPHRLLSLQNKTPDIIAILSYLRRHTMSPSSKNATSIGHEQRFIFAVIARDMPLRSLFGGVLKMRAMKMLPARQRRAAFRASISITSAWLSQLASRRVVKMSRPTPPRDAMHAEPKFLYFAIEFSQVRNAK